MDSADASFEKKFGELEKENKKLRKKIARLKKTMDITSRHSDVVAGELEEKVEASIREIEERVRMISETIPVPVIIARISDGKILYVNEHSCQAFGWAPDEFMKRNASELYDDPGDRQTFLTALSEQKRVSDFEVRLRRSDGGLLWVALFSQPLNFKNEPCALTVVYDLTERRKAEDEIRHLREQLSQKEIKYLMFKLDDVEYGIDILQVREILRMMPITPVPNARPYVKGVLNLRGRVIPVTDIRVRLGLDAAVFTNQTCIIVIMAGDEGNILSAIIADSVTNVSGIREKDIESPSALNFENKAGLISGIAKFEDDIRIIIDHSHL